MKTPNEMVLNAKYPFFVEYLRPSGRVFHKIEIKGPGEYMVPNSTGVTPSTALRFRYPNGKPVDTA